MTKEVKNFQMDRLASLQLFYIETRHPYKGLMRVQGNKISPFIHFMIQILSHRSNSVYTTTSYKILNDVTVCTLFDL